MCYCFVTGEALNCIVAVEIDLLLVHLLFEFCDMGITDFLLAFAIRAAVSVETVAVVVAGCILAEKAYYSIVALGVVQMQQQSIS